MKHALNGIVALVVVAGVAAEPAGEAPQMRSDRMAVPAEGAGSAVHRI